MAPTSSAEGTGGGFCAEYCRSSATFPSPTCALVTEWGLSLSAMWAASAVTSALLLSLGCVWSPLAQVGAVPGDPSPSMVGVPVNALGIIWDIRSKVVSLMLSASR